MVRRAGAGMWLLEATAGARWQAASTGPRGCGTGEVCWQGGTAWQGAGPGISP